MGERGQKRSIKDNKDLHSKYEPASCCRKSRVTESERWKDGQIHDKGLRLAFSVTDYFIITHYTGFRHLTLHCLETC